MDFVVFILDVNAGGGQYGIVVGAECVEVLGIDFGCTVSSEQVVFEEDADFGYDRRSVRMLGRCYLYGCNQVFLSVRAQHADGQLATRQNDRLAQILEHEAQGRCCICHGICAMKDDKTIV